MRTNIFTFSDQVGVSINGPITSFSVGKSVEELVEEPIFVTFLQASHANITRPSAPTDIHLIEIQGLNSLGILETRYFCTGTGYVSRPWDDPPNQVYMNRVINPGTYERHLWRPGQTQGGGIVTTGFIDIANLDGTLDEWLDWDFDGRTVTILSGDGTQARSTFMTFLHGTAQSVDLSFENVQINLRDRMAEVAETPLSTARYGGTNVLPDGVDGTPDDLGGKFIPQLFGEVENVACPRVNSSKLIYGINVRGIAELVGVYEGGLAWTPGTLRASTAALEATAPSTGTYDWTLGDANTPSYFRLGSSPALDVTAYVREGVTTAHRTVAQIAMRILALVGFPPVLTSRLAAFDAKNKAIVGLYIGSGGMTAGEALNQLCSSVGAVWTAHRNGEFDLLRLEQPDIEPVMEITLEQILSMPTIAPTDDTENGVPAYEIELSYARNYTAMSGAQVAGAVTDVRRDWLSKEYRQVVANNPLVWNPNLKTGANPLSKPLAMTTQLRSLADADAEATRRAILYGIKRRYLSVSIKCGLAGSVDLGDVVSLTMPRFGCDDGRAHLVVGMTENHATGVTELFLWR